ncbi:MAG: branched-chain amino acid ABC transporter permease [Geminicoccaceae bacterium]
MSAYLISIATFTGFFMMLALALNLQWGVTGMVNFGIAGFYGVGAYTSGLLSAKVGLPSEVTILVAPVVAAGLGACLAFLSLRLRDDFLAIVTLGFGEFVRLILLNEDQITNGPRGLPIPDRPLAGLFDRGDYALFYLALVAFFVILSYLIVERLRKAPYGRVLRAIREDDVVASVLGKHVLRFRVQVFALGSAIMGLAGALYAHYAQNVSPDVFTPMVAIFIWMSVIVGGAGNNRGLLIGAGVVMAILEGSRFLGDAVTFISAPDLSALRIIVIGLVLILMIRFRPEGLVPEPKFKASDA